MALSADLLDLPIEVAHPLPDAAALDLDLLLAETAASPHSPSPAAHLAVVRVGADQTRQQVMESSRLHLQPSFVSARVLGEDLEDDLGPVEDPSLDLQLEVALLTRAEVLVADHKVELPLELHVAKLVDLAHADEVRRVDLGPPLHVGADDLDACGAREVGQLGHLLAHSFLSGAWQEDANEKRPLTRAPGRDHLTGAPTKSRRAAPRADQRLGSPVLGFRGDFRA